MNEVRKQQQKNVLGGPILKETMTENEPTLKTDFQSERLNRIKEKHLQKFVSRQ